MKQSTETIQDHFADTQITQHSVRSIDYTVITRFDLVHRMTAVGRSEKLSDLDRVSANWKWQLP